MHRLLPRESGLQIAAVIATRNRADLLADRALASVAGQVRPPDFLIVADDSDAQERPRNAVCCVPGRSSIMGKSRVWNCARASAP